MASYEIWPFRPALFLSDTRDLTAAETGAYIKLLSFLWLTRHLPSDEKELARVAGMQGAIWKQSRDHLAALFYNVGKPGGWKHNRVDTDMAAAKKFQDRQRRAAKTRWQSQAVDNGEEFGPSREALVRLSNTLKSNDVKYPAAMPRQCHLSKTIKTTFGTSESADVDNLQNPVQASAVVDPINNNPLGSQRQSAQQRAQQTVLRALSAYLGDAYGDAIPILAAEPHLLERAAKAELRKAGSGVMAVLLGLKRHMRPDEVV